MGVDRKFNPKTRTRPKKTPGERRQRERVQRRRLIALGMTPESVKNLDGVHIRALLKYPERIRRKYAKSR